MKPIKNKIKAQTRPNSNQKIKSGQINSGSYAKEGYGQQSA